MHCRKSPIYPYQHYERKMQKEHYLTLLALTPPHANKKTDFNLDLKKKKKKAKKGFLFKPSCESKKWNLIELLNTN